MDRGGLQTPLFPAMDKDIERSALCSIIAKPADGYKAITLHNITPDCFTIGYNRTLFEVLERMLSCAEGFTKQSISIRMKSSDGSYDISMLEEVMGMKENRPGYWCDLVRMLTMKRHSEAIMIDAQRKLKNIFGVEECLSGFSEDIFQLLANWKIEENGEDDFNTMIVKTGFGSFLKPIRDVIITYPAGVPSLVGSRPGCGKTTFAVNEMLAHILKKKGDWYEYRPERHTMMFSLEMSRSYIYRKAACMLSGIDEREVRAGKLDGKKMEMLRAYYDLLRKAPMYIVDKGLQPRQICNYMRATCERKNTTFIALDYIQRVKAYSGRSKDREFYMRASNDIADTLKQIPSKPMMLILSQLSRDADMNRNMTLAKLLEAVPTLKSFKESGALEEEAYVAGVLYPDPKLMGASSPTEQYMVMEWLKNRGGETGVSKLMFKKRYQKFEKRS